MTDLSAVFSKAERFYDLLDGQSEISKKLLRRSPALRNRAASTTGDELPLEKFLRLTPNFSRDDLEAVYLEERGEFSNGERNAGTVLGDAFPSVATMELEIERAPVQAVDHPTDTSLKIGGFTVLEGLLSFDVESEVADIIGRYGA
jgi:hypothetical protein